jgi:hypothetical protein
MNTTPIDWIELDLAPIVNRYGWAATLRGLQSLLPLGESLAGLLEAIEDAAIEDLTEQAQATEQSDRAGYRSDCF